LRDLLTSNIVSGSNISGCGRNISERYILNTSAFSESDDVRLLSCFIKGRLEGLYRRILFVAFHRLPSFEEKFERLLTRVIFLCLARVFFKELAS